MIKKLLVGFSCFIAVTFFGSLTLTSYVLAQAQECVGSSTSLGNGCSAGSTSAQPQSGIKNTRDTVCTGFSSDSASKSFLGFPTWYKYLPIKDGCPDASSLEGIWAIVIAVIEILMRFAVLFTVGLIIWGGVKMIMSQGEPEGLTTGRKIVQNALIGLVITLVATAVVSFAGSQFAG